MWIFWEHSLIIVLMLGCTGDSENVNSAYDLEIDPFEFEDVFDNSSSYTKQLSRIMKSALNWQTDVVSPVTKKGGDWKNKWLDAGGCVPWVEDSNAPKNVKKKYSPIQPPNIVFILVDDWGWNDIGYQSTYMNWTTPNIDIIANDGIKLSNYFTYSSCAPSRAAFLTGRYTLRSGMWSGQAGMSVDLPLTEVTIAEELKSAGYRTYLRGKWMQGFTSKAYTPLYRGFDSFYGFYNGHIDYWTKKFGDDLDLHDEGRIVTNPNELSPDMHNGILLTTKAVDAISNHAVSYSDQPMFLMMASQLIHAPWQAPDFYFKKCEVTMASYTAATTAHAASNVSNNVSNSTRNRPTIDQINYCAMNLLLDESVKNITCALEKYGLANNTILVITSDNGGHMVMPGNNYPYRGSKGDMYRGGLSVPAIIHSSLIPKARRGGTYGGLMHVTDWLPTLLGLATEGKWKSGYMNQKFDGADMWEAIIKGDVSPRREIVHYIDSQSWVIQQDNLKVNFGAMSTLPAHTNSAFIFVQNVSLSYKGALECSDFVASSGRDRTPAADQKSPNIAVTIAKAILKLELFDPFRGTGSGWTPAELTVTRIREYSTAVLSTSYSPKRGGQMPLQVLLGPSADRNDSERIVLEITKINNGTAPRVPSAVRWLVTDLRTQTTYEGGLATRLEITVDGSGDSLRVKFVETFQVLSIRDPANKLVTASICKACTADRRRDDSSKETLLQKDVSAAAEKQTKIDDLPVDFLKFDRSGGSTSALRPILAGKWRSQDSTAYLDVTAYEVTSLDSQILYYSGTLCSGELSTLSDSDTSNCNIRLDKGLYIWRVGGALSSTRESVSWLFCDTKGGASSELVFSVDSEGNCVPLREFSVFDSDIDAMKETEFPEAEENNRKETSPSNSVDRRGEMAGILSLFHAELEVMTIAPSLASSDSIKTPALSTRELALLTAVLRAATVTALSKPFANEAAFEQITARDCSSERLSSTMTLHTVLVEVLTSGSEVQRSGRKAANVADKLRARLSAAISSHNLMDLIQSEAQTMGLPALSHVVSANVQRVRVVEGFKYQWGRMSRQYFYDIGASVLGLISLFSFFLLFMVICYSFFSRFIATK